MLHNQRISEALRKVSDTDYQVSSIDTILGDSWGYMLCKALSCLMQKISWGYGIYGIGMIYESSKEVDFGKSDFL